VTQKEIHVAEAREYFELFCSCSWAVQLRKLPNEHRKQINKN